MNKESDLLPWILGALSIATAAAAITFVANNKTAARNVPAPLQAAAISLPPAHVVPIATHTPAPTAPVAPAAAPDADAAAPPPPSVNQSPRQNGQIWECTINGQKTFSNNPCGNKAAMLDIGPVNTMEATPVFHAGRSYATPPSYAEPEYNSPPDDTYADSQGSAGSSYPVYVGVPYAVQIRPQHRHPDHKHANAPPARKY
jgi:hypothetical protein